MSTTTLADDTTGEGKAPPRLRRPFRVMLGVVLVALVYLVACMVAPRVVPRPAVLPKPAPEKTVRKSCAEGGGITTTDWSTEGGFWVRISFSKGGCVTSRPAGLPVETTSFDGP